MSTRNANVAVLWDESFLWGLMCHKALVASELPFDLVTSEDVREGTLDGYQMLVVPGGWASNKLVALRQAGVAAVQRFVRMGGHYLGFCGGAGLATLDGIGLLPVGRRPSRERVPSFSGRVGLSLTPVPLWANVKCPIFHAWWPSQFLVHDSAVRTIATYGDAFPDSFSSDLNVGDVIGCRDWSELERAYGILLDPRRLLGEPAVVEGTFGKGKVILSLVHFDTPNDPEGATVLKNLWSQLAPGEPAEDRGTTSAEGRSPGACAKASEGIRSEAILSDLDVAVTELISLGLRNFLWFWRTPMLLQWRRGVRGLEYCTLHAMIKETTGLVRGSSCFPADGPLVSLGSEAFIRDRLHAIRELLLPFTKKATDLLVLERLALQSGAIVDGEREGSELQEARAELFSTSRSHAGLFKRLVDEIALLLYPLLKQENLRRAASLSRSSRGCSAAIPTSR